MKVDYKTILIAALIGLVIALILLRGCDLRHSSNRVDVELIYDSIEKVIVSKLPPPDTIIEINETEVIRWLPSAMVVDTIYINGATTYVYNDAPIDTAAILTHYLTQAVTYIDTIRDSSLQAVISDTIFRNEIVGRGFEYKILRPIEIIDKTDRFQFHVLGGVGSSTNLDSISRLRLPIGFMMEFKTGTSLVFKYDYTIASPVHHGFELMVAQRLRFKKPRFIK